MTNLTTLHSQLYSPFQQEFDRIFSDFFDEFFDNTSAGKMKDKSGYPKMDVLSEEGKFIIRAVVPGVDPKNIKVEVVEGMVIMSGEMEEEHKSNKSNNFYVHELHKSKFYRSVNLPQDLEQENDPDAKFKNGILTLTWNRKALPKAPPPKLISIKAEE